MRPYARIFLCFLSLWVSLSSVSAQRTTRPGDWRTYLSNSNALQSIFKDGQVYTITSGGMFSYDTTSQEVQTFSTVEGLNGINPTSLYHDPRSNTAFIGYADGMINYFVDPTDIRAITDIQRNEFYTAKAIHDFASDENYLYVATDFGLVIFDLSSRLPVFTVTQFATNASRLPVAAVSLYNDRIWATLEKGELYSAPSGFPNLSDPNIWRKENGREGLPLTTFVYEARGNAQGLYARLEDAVWIKQQGQWGLFDPMNEKYDRIYVQENVVAASRINRTLVINANNGPRYNFFVEGGVRHVYIADVDEFYVAKQFTGMDRFKNWSLRQILPTGPSTNFSTRVIAHDGEIYVAPRGYGSSLVPEPDASGVYYFRPDQGWQSLTRANGALPPNRVNTGFARAYFDTESGTAYLGSFGKGLLEIRQGRVEAYYDCANADLSTVSGVCDTTKFDETRVSGISLDRRGQLWLTLTFAQHPLMYRTRESVWKRIPATRFPSGIKFVDMITDDFGSAWIINEGKGLIVYHDGNTPDQTNDDRVLTINPIRTNLNDKCDGSNEVLSLAKDQEGFIWVGTSKGVLVYYDPYSISQGALVEATRPVFNGRCLLENERVFSIAVDGANRKWFATENGVFLMSADGESEQIHHFTERNSPLLSDKVNHIAIDQVSGEVFFSTDKGIISYVGDATEGTPSCEEVQVYPNPVFTDFDGDIVIRGSAAGTKVKIVTVSGMLVRELTANGGTTLWDGKDLRGDKVHSGIYLALMANDDGENPCIGKFAVIQK